MDPAFKFQNKDLCMEHKQVLKKEWAKLFVIANYKASVPFSLYSEDKCCKICAKYVSNLVCLCQPTRVQKLAGDETEFFDCHFSVFKILIAKQNYHYFSQLNIFDTNIYF